MFIESNFFNLYMDMVTYDITPINILFYKIYYNDEKYIQFATILYKKYHWKNVNYLNS